MHSTYFKNAKLASIAPLALAALFGFSSPVRSAMHPLAPQHGKKDYLTEAETDKIRDAETQSERIKIYISFAEDKLKKFQYELDRKTPERRRSDVLNGLLNGYSGCVDDAADQIAVAQEKQTDIHSALKIMIAKSKEFTEILDKLEQGGPEFGLYKDTLDDAVEGTKDALAEAEKAEKEMAPAPVRRKP
jgi:DNA repair exonuclease SbcCD ATPase subunit